MFGPARTMTQHTDANRGFTLIELILTMAVAATLTGIAIPVIGSTIDEIRVAGAARHVAASVAAARIDAVRRSTNVGLRFVASGSDYSYMTYQDTNGNGLRTAEITSGVDVALSARECLHDKYPGAQFGLLAGIPDLDGLSGSTDGVRVGTSRILTLSPNGSATSGTLYLHGRRGQYAVRVLGATGRTRVFEYDTGARRWVSR
jgi:prepilin-type N-terminal cleavage/methylation domain-containing protein